MRFPRLCSLEGHPAKDIEGVAGEDLHAQHDAYNSCSGSPSFHEIFTGSSYKAEEDETVTCINLKIGRSGKEGNE